MLMPKRVKYRKAQRGRMRGKAQRGSTLAFGEYEQSIFFSLRTSDRRMNAGRLIREVVEAKGGSAGGHGTMAGARLSVKGLSAAARRRLREEVVRAFLDAFGVSARKGKPLA